MDLEFLIQLGCIALIMNIAATAIGLIAMVVTAWKS